MSRMQLNKVLPMKSAFIILTIWIAPLPTEKRTALFKVLTQPGKNKILGVTIVGEHAGDLLAEFVLAMKHGLGLNKILGSIHIYPTMAEANKYVAGIWKRNHAPQGLLSCVKKFHDWRRG